MDREDGGRSADQRDVREVADWIERNLRERGGDCMRCDAGHDERIAIGRAFRRRIRADHAAGARTILDDERLTEAIGELRADEASQRVRAAAGGEGGDYADGFGGPGLGGGWGGREKKRDQKRSRVFPGLPRRPRIALRSSGAAAHIATPRNDI